MTTSIKTCFKCLEEKPATEFYRHSAMADGRLGKCKSCTKSDVKVHRSENLEEIRAYDRSRGNRQTNEYRESHKATYPVKTKAHRIVSNSIKEGHLQRAPCEVCGSEFSHAHHDDYFKPLLVRWLCAAHHKQWHETNGEAANGSASIEEFNVAVYGLKQA